MMVAMRSAPLLPEQVHVTDASITQRAPRPGHNSYHPQPEPEGALEIDQAPAELPADVAAH